MKLSLEKWFIAIIALVFILTNNISLPGPIENKSHKTLVTPVKMTGTSPIQVNACIMFRLWSGDQFGMTHHHLRHWVSYMRTQAGVTHITAYCNNDDNCSHTGLFDTLIAWPERDYPTAQHTAITHCILNQPQDSWLIVCDVDEYPFMPNDTAPGFLPRFVQSTTEPTDQILLRTMFFGEKDKYVTQDQPLYDAYTFRMPYAEDPSTRTKSLFRVDRLLVPHILDTQPNIVHAMVMPNTLVADPDILRLNHYWGYRLNYPVNELVHDASLKST